MIFSCNKQKLNSKDGNGNFVGGDSCDAIVKISDISVINKI